MDIAAAQLLFDRLGRLDRIDLVTDPARPVEEVRRAVQALLPPELIAKRPQQRKDRKSTRLNSSHGYISYAVFCLKKKKSHRIPSPPSHAQSCCGCGMV